MLSEIFTWHDKKNKDNTLEAPENESFRDSIGTINEEGKRAWVYPKKAKW